MAKEEKTISFSVETDENNIPQKIGWNSSDDKEEKEAKAVFITIWDQEEGNTLRIDLWNKYMQVDEMKHFVHQSMITMADTLERATSDKELSSAIRKFSEAFGQRINEEK